MGAVVLPIVAGAEPAAATVDGPCTASFNGVEHTRIDSLSSPLELDADDVLTFHGSDDTGTQAARVEVILAMVTVRDGAATYGPLQNEFSASLDLGEVSPYGVGLFRVRGVTDNCTVEAWVRISGRFPFATLTGLTAGALALGGFAAQMTAIAVRRRRAAWAALFAGVVTGVGIAGAAQQFGRLQLSIPSIAIVSGIAAVLGALIAILLSPRERPGWLERRRDSSAQRRAIRYQARLEAARLDAERRETEAAARVAAAEAAHAVAQPAPSPVVGPVAEPTPLPTTDPAPEPAIAPVREPIPAPAPTPVPATTPEPGPATAPVPMAAVEGPSWCYVLAPVDVFGLTDHTRTVAVLQPGNWYLAKRQAGGWVQVVVGGGVEGWVPQTAIHKHG